MTRDEPARTGRAPTTELARDYASGLLSKDSPHERRRLALLEAWGDPETRAVLAQCDLTPSSRCLEIGAGAGSVARWLARQCPDGEVLAVDSDARYLNDPDDPAEPALQWRQADVRTLDLAPGSVDLIHSRLTFCHLDNRDEMLTRAVRWLRPGGWLALCDPMLMPASASADPDVRLFFGAMHDAFAAQSADMSGWAASLPARLAAAGLTSIGVRPLANMLGDGGAYDRLAASNVEQEGSYLVERGLVPAALYERILARLRSSQLVELRSITIYAWGRKPAAGEGGVR